MYKEFTLSMSGSFPIMLSLSLSLYDTASNMQPAISGTSAAGLGTGRSRNPDLNIKKQ